MKASLEINLDTKYIFDLDDIVFFYGRKRILKGKIRMIQFKSTFLTQVSNSSVLTTDLNQDVFYKIEYDNKMSSFISHEKVAATREELINKVKKS